MGEKDMSEKILEDYNDEFSDIVNVHLFHGQELIAPSALESISVHSQYKGEDAKLHEQERDVAKKRKRYNVQLAIIGIENQTAVEKKMPFRLIGYDGASYKSQLQANAASIAQVVSIVLYFGRCSLIRLHSSTSASSSESVTIYSNRAICVTIFSICGPRLIFSRKYDCTLLRRRIALPT